MATVGWIYDPFFLLHQTEDVHPDRPERLTAIRDALEESGVLAALEPLPFLQARPEQAALIHEPAYVDVVRMVCDDGFTYVGARDTQICPYSYDVAMRAVGGVWAAADAIMAGRVDRAFCALRPPGHHAEADQAMGFCLFNNVAIAAEHLIRHHGLSRVAIVDFDAHHGNGTQHAFESRADVLYISLHERSGSMPFPGTGEEWERGRGDGHGYTLNIPMVRASTDRDYREAFDRQVIPALTAYEPEALLLSAGFDAVVSEWVAHLALEPESFRWMTRLLVEIADQCASGRLLSVLEGGYDLKSLRRSVLHHVQELL